MFLRNKTHDIKQQAQAQYLWNLNINVRQKSLIIFFPILSSKFLLKVKNSKNVLLQQNIVLGQKFFFVYL